MRQNQSDRRETVSVIIVVSPKSLVMLLAFATARIFGFRGTLNSGAGAFFSALTGVPN
jgi:hypothetical protein